MFRSAIEKLESQNTIHYLSVKDGLNTYLIIKIPNKDNSNQYYAIDKQILGKGTFGTVYKAYPISTTGDADFDKTLAMKVFHDKSDFNENEVKVLSHHYKVINVIYIDDQVWVLQEFIPGYDLMPSLKTYKFNFNQIVEIMWKISICLNQIHHNTASTGSALIHCDLKPDNIRINYNATTGEIDVHIIDFGQSEEAADHADKLKSSVSGKGSIYYIAPEAYGGRYSVKSDIYSLTPIFLSLLGAPNPLRSKDAQDNPFANPMYMHMKIAHSPFCFSGIFSTLEVPANLAELKPIITSLLKRMESSDYILRPDIEEVMRFMTSLYILCKLNSQNINIHSEEGVEHHAKMILIASNFWKKPFDFEYQTHPHKCNILSAIVVLHKHKMLNIDIIKSITGSASTLSYAIIQFNCIGLSKAASIATIINLFQYRMLEIDMIDLITAHISHARQIDESFVNSNPEFLLKLAYLATQREHDLPSILQTVLHASKDNNWPSFVLYIMDNRDILQIIFTPQIYKILETHLLSRLNQYIQVKESELASCDDSQETHRNNYSFFEGYSMSAKYNASKFLFNAIVDRQARSHFFESKNTKICEVCEKSDLKAIAEPYIETFKKSIGTYHT